MNESVRQQEKKNPTFLTETAKTFNRLAETVKNSKKTSENAENKKIFFNNRIVQRHSRAKNKYLSIDQNKWLKNRSSHNNKDSNLAKQIFMMLDSQNTKKVTAKEFLSFLVEIGVPVNAKSLSFLLQKFFNTQDLSHKLINEENILYLCCGDKSTKRILNVLNESVRNFFHKSDYQDISCDEQNNLIQNWWKQLSPLQSNIVPNKTICEFFVEMKMADNYFESKKLLDAVGHSSAHFDYSQFYLIFAKALIKHTLTGLNKKFNEDDWNNTGLSYPFKLCQLKRQLILAGIQCPVEKITQDEGTLVINGIENLEKFNNKPLEKTTFEEFKSNWYKHTNIRPNLYKNDKNCQTLESSESEQELAVFHPKINTEPTPKANENKYKKSKINEEEIMKNMRKRYKLNYAIFKGSSFDRSMLPERKKEEYFHKRNFKTSTKHEESQEKLNLLYEKFQKVVYNMPKY